MGSWPKVCVVQSSYSFRTRLRANPSLSSPYHCTFPGTLFSHLGQNVGLGGRWAVSQKRVMIPYFLPMAFPNISGWSSLWEWRYLAVQILVVSRLIERENASRLATSLGCSREKNEGESQSLLAGSLQEKAPLPVEVRTYVAKKRCL